MRTLFKERKLIKGGNYMRKYGMCFCTIILFVLLGRKCCAINDADNWIINWQWDHIDEFHTEDLQECEGFEIEYSEEEGFPYHGRVTLFHSGRDGWNGQYVRVLTDTGVYWQCQLDDWVNADEIKIIDCKIGHHHHG